MLFFVLTFYCGGYIIISNSKYFMWGVVMKNKIWAYFMQLGDGMWKDYEPGDGGRCIENNPLRLDSTSWNNIVDRLVETNAANTLVIDVGDGIQYETHPEIVRSGAWSKQRLADEIARLRSLGFKVYPKLNFSAGHDKWMGIYSRMLSTPQYYKFCKDVIDEVSELFSKPELFHLGMDEECLSIQQKLPICIIRQGELYWHDQKYLFKLAEENGARPWIWADFVWHKKANEQPFLENISKEVLLSNWYYQRFNDPENDWHYPAYKAYELLDKHGYDQIPCGSNYVHRDNFELTVEHCTKHISDDKLLGFMMAPWKLTMPEFEEHHLEGVDAMAETRKKFGGM